MRRVGTNRFSFLLDSLHDLDASFKARGSRLIIVHGNPPDIVPKLITVSGVHDLQYAMLVIVYS